jgi:hypothetical protein
LGGAYAPWDSKKDLGMLSGMGLFVGNLKKTGLFLQVIFYLYNKNNALILICVIYV